MVRCIRANLRDLRAILRWCDGICGYLCDLWAAAMMRCPHPASSIALLQQPHQISNGRDRHRLKRKLRVRRASGQRDPAKTQSGGLADPLGGTTHRTDLAEEADLAKDRDVVGKRPVRRR